MTVPSVTYNVLNGRLGVRPPGGVECHAYVGPCSTGTKNRPTRHVRSADLISIYTSGPTPELACKAIESWKGDILAVRSEASTASSFGTLDLTSVTGACDVTTDAGATSDDDYEAKVRIVKGGTVGVAGITYQTSLDNGRTWSTTLALGTATTITIAGSGGIKFDLTSAGLNAGDTCSLPAHAPASTSVKSSVN